MIRNGLAIGGLQALAAATLLQAATEMRRQIMTAVANGLDEEKAVMQPMADLV